MKDDIIKTLIIVAFAGLIIYWGITGFDISANWVALVGPILLGYLFKPSNSKKDNEDTDTCASSSVSKNETDKPDMGDTALPRFAFSIYNLVLSGSS